MTRPLDVAPEVARAIDNGRAVVALESTIVAHGMPWPRNHETALAVEDAVRRGGAIPATVAVIGGRLRVGLAAYELEKLAHDGAAVMKLSSRDLGYAVAKGIDGATTVAATMRIAAMAGIAVFATGGIGGVHRGAQQSFDVSADLTEFAGSPVAVVTAGAKAILDLGLTLEMLETCGVPVVGYGTDMFPAFYSRDSGHRVPARLDTPEEVAAFMTGHWSVSPACGIVVANPIPPENEIPAAELEPAIERAVADAAREGISGKAVTPYLLGRLAALTAERSLAANIALVIDNARVAAAIAGAYAKMKQ
jgi:pseudouridine-5'-phosphate glycosidase